MRAAGRRALVEAGGLLTITLLATATLGYLLRGSWDNIFFYNGDSIVLPLVQQSLQRGEPFEWTFSSQLFLFPEGVMYAASAVVGHGHARATLATNAVLNVLVLYLLVRVCARWLCGQMRPMAQAATAVAATSVYFVFVLFEYQQNLSAGTIATLFMTTTYYYGTALAGMGVLALVLAGSRGFSVEPKAMRDRRTSLTLTGLALLGGATTLSNPLFLIQVVPTATICLALVALLRREFRWSCVWFFAALLVGSVLGFAGRGPLGGLIGSGTGGYIHLEQIGASVRLVWGVAREGLGSWGGKVKAVVFVAMLLCAVVSLVRSRLTGERRTAVIFVATWSLASPMLLLLATFSTGSLVTRYLIPSFIFPLAGIVSLAATLPTPRLRTTYQLITLVLATCVAAALCVVGLPSAKRAVTGPPRAGGLACLETWLNGRKDLTGAGSFWVTRQLNLYGEDAGIHLLQVVPGNLRPFLWMTNRAEFVDRKVTYLLVFDEYPNLPDWPDVVATKLGPPQTVTSCGGFDIYDYAGTPAARFMTKRASGSERKLAREVVRR